MFAAGGFTVWLFEYWDYVGSISSVTISLHHHLLSASQHTKILHPNTHAGLLISTQMQYGVIRSVSEYSLGV